MYLCAGYHRGVWVSQGVVVGVIGRFASEPSQPFEPRIETNGFVLSGEPRRSAAEALQAAWEATDPWAPKDELAHKAEEWLTRSLEMSGITGVQVLVVVIDGLPFRVGEGQVR